MTATPPTIVSYTLEEILNRFEQKMDSQFAEVNKQFLEVNKQFAEVNQKLNKLEIGQVELSGEIKTLQVEISGKIKTLDEKVSGIDKRLDNQEFINRGVLVALIVALVGGAAKLFGWLPTS